MRSIVAAVLLASAVILPTVEAAAAKPLVLAHRGASAYRPEHTLAAYELAIRQGADFVEPDLVATKDGVLVARHENEISTTTDVASRPEFASLRKTKTIDNVELTGWFTEDFTLAELKTLKAVERIPQLRPGNVQYNGQFEVPTLQEVIDLVRRLEGETGRTIGIIPETKHPTYFDSVGLSLEEPLVAVLNANGYTGADDAVIIQSFEVGNLQLLNTLTQVRLVQLAGATGKPYDFVVSGDSRTYADLFSATGLDFVNDYADLIGPDKSLVIPRDLAGNLLAPTDLVANAHAAGLLVTPYTFRPENFFLPLQFRSSLNPAEYGDLAGELAAYFAAGIDGFFIDSPDIGVAAVAVPEPATWMMMIGGFGLLGGMIRRRRTPLVLA